MDHTTACKARAANEEEIHDYRPHRFGITRLTNGSFALFSPDGEHIALGTIEEVVSSILTGPEVYDQCVDNWISRPRPSATKDGLNLLQSLGLAKPQPSVKIERRF
jgi:hypothetical protein